MTGEPAPDPHGAAPPQRWHLVVPVKEAGRAKSRLAPPDPWSRPELARAMAGDTVDAVCRALLPGRGSVTVVTSDPEALALAQELGAGSVADPGRGLNAAVRAGLERARARLAEHAGVAVLLGDLPALRPQDLLTALAACGEHDRAVVPDADGSGTVLLTARDGIPEPEFGRGSAARHAVGATRLDLGLPRLRRDVDTADDLASAIELGVGTRTSAVLAARTSR